MPQGITLSCKKDDVEGSLPLSLMEAEKFPGIPFDSIAISGRSDLLLHHHTQPVKPQFVLLKEEGEMFGLNSFPPLITFLNSKGWWILSFLVNRNRPFT